MIPRTVKRSKPPPALTKPAVASTSFLPRAVRPNSSQASSASASTPTVPASNSKGKERAVEPEEELSTIELSRLSLIAWTVITCLSPHSLSLHRSSGLLQKFKNSKDGYVHLQILLNLPPIAALTKVQAEVQKALKLFLTPDSREENVVIDESGFRVGFKVQPDWLKLEGMNSKDWDYYVVYLDHIPSISTSFSLINLRANLEKILGVSIQNILLPALEEFRGRRFSHSKDSQAEQYELDRIRANEVDSNGNGKEIEFTLPKGGGPFKSAAFIVLEQKADIVKVLKDWPWLEESEVVENGKVLAEKESTSSNREEVIKDTASIVEKLELEIDEEDEGLEKMMDLVDQEILEETISSALVETLTEAEDPGFGGLLSAKLGFELKKEELEENRLREAESGAARADGMRASTFAHWRKIKVEQDKLKAEKTNSYPRRRHRSSSPPTHHQNQNRKTPLARQLPPHQSLTSANHKRLSHYEQNDSESKRSKVAGHETEESEFMEETYPKGCIVWLRGIHPKSTKSSLRLLFNSILKEIGSKREGIEFVDFEKSMDTCHIRLSTASLSQSILDYFIATPQYHLSPTFLSATDTSGTSLVAVRVEILKEEREGIYWEKLRRGNSKAWELACKSEIEWKKREIEG